MSEKQTKNTKEILSNVWNWEHTEDGGRRAIHSPHPILTTKKMLQEIQDKIGDKKSFPKYIKERALKEKGKLTLHWDSGKHQSRVYDKIIGIDSLYSVELLVPISLSRVLSALGHPYYYFDDEIKKYYDSGLQDRIICERKLLNEDNSDCMLSDQSHETIKAIWEIVCK